MQTLNVQPTNANTPYPVNSHLRHIDQKSLQDLLKRELRMTIMAKRHARGESELKMECQEHPLSHEMTMADLERKERRREQNRRAAQRCRRKKRMNQMSVLQNYEWIITRNQQLQQEVEQLRQELTRLQTVLKAHRNACTCAHAQKGPLHALAPNVKVEPREDSPLPHAGFATPPPCHPGLRPAPTAASASSVGSPCQYRSSANENALVCDPSASAMPQQYGLGLGSQHSMGYTTSSNFSSTTSSSTSCSSSSVSPSSFASRNGFPHAQNGRRQPYPVPQSDDPYNHSLHMLEGSPNMQAVTPSHGHGQDHLQDDRGFLGSAAGFHGPAQMGLTQHGPPPMSGHRLDVLEELVSVPGGVRSCVFQEGAVTPLSADGRRSISSVSSDISSTASEPPPSRDVAMTSEAAAAAAADVPIGDFYVTDDVTPHDVSQLLSQINQNDLLFQQEGGLDEVFTDSMAGMASLPEHFLHNI